MSQPTRSKWRRHIQPICGASCPRQRRQIWWSSRHQLVGRVTRRTTKIRPKAVGSDIFHRFANFDKCRLEVGPSRQTGQNGPFQGHQQHPHWRLSERRNWRQRLSNYKQKTSASFPVVNRSDPEVQKFGSNRPTVVDECWFWAYRKRMKIATSKLCMC